MDYTAGERVAQYDLEAGGFLGSDGQMVEAESGDYVLTSDYAALEARCVELEKSVGRWEEVARIYKEQYRDICSSFNRSDGVEKIKDHRIYDSEIRASKAEAELIALRSKPPVTDEMVRAASVAANRSFRDFYIPEQVIRLALEAALASKGVTP